MKLTLTKVEPETPANPEDVPHVVTDEKTGVKTHFLGKIEMKIGADTMKRWIPPE